MGERQIKTQEKQRGAVSRNNYSRELSSELILSRLTAPGCFSWVLFRWSYPESIDVYVKIVVDPNAGDSGSAGVTVAAVEH